MQLTIITPDQEVFEGEVESATFPGSDGSFQVLRNHAPLVSSLGKGDIAYRGKAGEGAVTVEGGVVEVLNNTITVLAERVISE
ncbi:ATP synthase F1 subunit epsilon [Tunicatimonas pelagia]|uniref:ATP synthase F1 subunit epsilon n=1 Tax=Tunicatimonas pelagia TaxID=931531 RepID=UPI0026659630|nr:ATP synthase F1 subunit epsilon [Tunicatimonas pelagia]WKN45039.1 ATP synthase F1 subunit epsilon [Tunicatimonas pelagia]